MLGIGVLVALQSEINGRLATQLGTGVRAGATAALISFGSGFVVLTVLALLEPRTRRGVLRIAAAARDGRLHWWQLVGGAAGAFVVACQGLTVGTIGVALFTVALVAGQSSNSLLVDHVGLGPAGRQRITAARICGAGLTVAAVAIAVSERLGGTKSLGSAAVAFALLPLLAGFGAAYQQAVNGRVNHVGGPWATTWNNFCVGTGVLLAFSLVSLAVPGRLSWPIHTWWLYSGGLIGIAFISAAAVLVRTHGVLVLGLCTVAGQVSGALAIDLAVDAAHVGWLSVAGAALTLAGVAVATASGSRRGSSRAHVEGSTSAT